MCSPFQRLIARYVKGKLPPYESSLIEFHLNMCEDCRRNAARMTSVLNQRRAGQGLLPRLLAFLAK